MRRLRSPALKGRWRRPAAVALLVLAATIACSAVVITASNSVPATNLLDQQNDPSWITLAPPQCSSLALVGFVTGNGNLTGTNAAQLMLGRGANQTIQGKNGNDCLLGGGGNDSLNGGGGTDVCIGGPGTDSFTASCETQIQ